jgi:hypothetical protein
MKLKSFNYLTGLLIFLLFSPLWSEEKIDLWKNNTKQKTKTSNSSTQTIQENGNTRASNIIESTTKIQIEDKIEIVAEKENIYGIFEPANYDLNLNMWSNTKADELRSSLKRLEKIKLSNSSKEILEIILLSFSYPPSGMSEKEFVKLKIDWLIKNEKINLIEDFLKQNQEFESKSKAVQYLVDQSIASANIKEGCDKIKFIDAKIKDPYLEKFKIYCLVFSKKNSEAQLLLDLLREQNLSSKFYDNRINFLLGLTEKTDNKIDDKNLLNFYLSSITTSNFNYEASSKTKPEIWKYLNAANLIKFDEANSREKLKKLEISANNNRLDKKTIFEFYRQIPFNLNNLINAKNTYQTFDETDARALIYQKYLLSETNENKIEYLFVLEDLFKKSNLINVYSEFLSKRIEEIGIQNLPERYRETAQSRIISDDSLVQGKIKYNDKILHKSKILKYFVEGENKKKVQKDIDKIFKKVSKNNKYFISAKDLALADALIKDGFTLPANFKYDELSKKYEIPDNLLKLIDNEQKAFLTLKIVEIIGEDEIYQLDPETIYFVTNLLNKMSLYTIRNKVIVSALPERA